MANMQQTSGEELLNTQTSDNGQVGDKVVSVNEEDYKNLQSVYTRANQERIDLAVKLANKDKSYLLEITDKKLQDKVVKEIYNLDNIEEVKMLHGNEFYKDKDESEDDGLSELEKMKKELTLMKHKQSKSELEREIDEYKKENKNFFLDGNMETSFRNEIQYLSSDLPIKERINRASKIVFGINATDAAYIALTQTGKQSEGQSSSTKTNTNVEEEIKRIFNRYK